jgi:flagellar protein FliJ
MARFVFNLQTVLEQREREEQLAQMDYAQARLEQKRLEEELATLEVDLKASNEHMRDKHLVGTIDTAMLAAHRRYLISMRTLVITVAQKIATARLKVEATQRKLAEAAKHHKAIEVLRDRQKSRWTAEQDRKELASADDVAMQIAYQNLSITVGGGNAA